MEKIDRSAFLYMEPPNASAEQDFAQCATCAYWDRADHDCQIIGIKVEGGWSCGLYVRGPQAIPDEHEFVSAKEAGLVRREVRCENCYFGGSKCALYVTLNRLAPKLFQLEEKISPKACCNANTPR